MDSSVERVPLSGVGLSSIESLFGLVVRSYQKSVIVLFNIYMYFKTVRIILAL